MFWLGAISTTLDRSPLESCPTLALKLAVNSSDRTSIPAMTTLIGGEEEREEGLDPESFEQTRPTNNKKYNYHYIENLALQ